MKIAITGHRPNKLGNDYTLISPLVLWIRDEIYKILWEKNPNILISGMALGIDTLFAQMAIENHTPFIAAIPFSGQHSKWPISSQSKYFEMLSKAQYAIIVDENRILTALDEPLLRMQLSRNNYSIAKMQLRNKWMVDNCDLLIAVWDGSSGGTANCVKYAESVNREIIKINPKHYG